MISGKPNQVVQLKLIIYLEIYPSLINPYFERHRASHVLVTHLVRMLNRIATDSLAKVSSTSWAVAELTMPRHFVLTENNIFRQMAAQGQSMFAAAGDSGAFGDGWILGVLDPAS